MAVAQTSHVGAANSKPNDVVKNSEQHDVVLKTFRLLIADLCQQFNGGHPGYDPYARAETEPIPTDGG